MLATHNGNGDITGFYDPRIHGDKLPADAVELTDEEWLDCINNPGRRRIDPATRRVIPYAPPIDAATVKAAAKRAVDQTAEKVRLRHITPGDGQSLVYARKEAQARACLAAHDAANPPPAGAYPALEAEIGINGADVLAVAQVVVGLADAWGAIADQIEALRLSAKAAIAAVPDDAPDLEAQIAAIEASIVWPAP